jgi:hypothetical protein
MQGHLLSRGRKKAVQKFTTQQGLWILGVVLLMLTTILLLFTSGILRVDMD